MILIFINLLTVSRIALGGIIFILLSVTEYYWASFILFFIAASTDYFDGYFARKYQAVSEIGEILDPIADKILIVFLFCALSVSLSSFYIAFSAALIITREIWVGALRDYNARQSNTSLTKVTFLAKIKTTLQLFTISTYLLGLSLNNMLILVLGDFFLGITIIITLFTGYQYSLNTFQNSTDG